MRLDAINALLNQCLDRSPDCLAQVAASLTVRFPRLSDEIRSSLATLISARASADGDFWLPDELAATTRIVHVPEEIREFLRDPACLEAVVDLPPAYTFRDYQITTSPGAARKLFELPEPGVGALQVDILRRLADAVRDYWRKMTATERPENALVCLVPPYHDTLWVPLALFLVHDLVRECKITFRLSWWPDIGARIRDTLVSTGRVGGKAQAANVAHVGYFTNDVFTMGTDPDLVLEAVGANPVHAFDTNPVYRTPNAAFALSRFDSPRDTRVLGRAINFVGTYAAERHDTQRGTLLRSVDGEVFEEQRSRVLAEDEPLVLTALALGMLAQDVVVVPSYHGFAWACQSGLVMPGGTDVWRSYFGTIRRVDLIGAGQRGSVSSFVFKGATDQGRSAVMLAEAIRDVVGLCRSQLEISDEAESEANVAIPDVLATRRLRAVPALMGAVGATGVSFRSALHMLPAGFLSRLICDWGVTLDRYHADWWDVAEMLAAEVADEQEHKATEAEQGV